AQYQFSAEIERRPINDRVPACEPLRPPPSSRNGAIPVTSVSSSIGAGAAPAVAAAQATKIPIHLRPRHKCRGAASLEVPFDTMVEVCRGIGIATTHSYRKCGPLPSPGRYLDGADEVLPLAPADRGGARCPHRAGLEVAQLVRVPPS